MHEPAIVATPLASARVFLLTFLVIAGAFLVILALDLSLSKIERIATASHAASLYAEGKRVLAAGEVNEAVDRFSDAMSLERDSGTYAVALGEAILARGDAQQAEATLRPRLEADPTNGAINLAMARVLVKEGRIDDATSYYHRAIYGRWSADTSLNRTRARSELIDLLAKAQRREELLAELLALESASTDVASRKRLGRLFLIAGSPQRAATEFRAVLRAAPDDPDAYAGMGEASLAQGNFRTARTDFRLASQDRPGDPRVDSLLTLADTVVELDPQVARAGVGENYRLGLTFLHRTITSVLACPGGTAIPAVAVAADTATALDRAHLPAAKLDAQADANLALAVQVKLRPASCPLATFGDQALAALQGAMAQHNPAGGE